MGDPGDKKGQATEDPGDKKGQGAPASAFRDLFMNLSSGTGGSLYESVNSKSVNSAGTPGGSREGTPFDPNASGSSLDPQQ